MITREGVSINQTMMMTSCRGGLPCFIAHKLCALNTSKIIIFNKLYLQNTKITTYHYCTNKYRLKKGISTKKSPLLKSSTLQNPIHVIPRNASCVLPKKEMEKNPSCSLLTKLGRKKKPKGHPLGPSSSVFESATTRFDDVMYTNQFAIGILVFYRRLRAEV